MNDNILTLDVKTKLNLPIERVLDGAAKANEQTPMVACLVIGENGDGDLYFASTEAKWGEMLRLLERAKYFCMRHIEND